MGTVTRENAKKRNAHPETTPGDSSSNPGPTGPPISFRSVRDTCKILKLKPHVLRYWEREFDIKVKRNSAGRRIYSETQVEKLRFIRHLIREERLTVKGAKKKLERMRLSPQQAFDFDDRRINLLWVKKELIAIRGLLEPEESETFSKRR